MTRYASEAEAARDGIKIIHEADHHRFRAVQEIDGASKVLGEAHYSLLGAVGAETIDFDHTVVDPARRGSGIAALLAQHALTSDIVTGRRIAASCWYIEGYLNKHPELRG